MGSTLCSLQNDQTNTEVQPKKYERLILNK